MKCRFQSGLNRDGETVSKSGKSISLYTLTAVLIIITTLSAGDHQITVGPRAGYFKEDSRTYSQYFLGLSVGYGYGFNAGEMFRFDLEAENFIDFHSDLNGKWNDPAADLFIEPGIGILFTRLLTFAPRLNIGFSYRFTRRESVMKMIMPNNTIQSAEYTSNTHKNGIFLNPGLFLMNDRGHIGLIMLNRFYSGKTKYNYDDPQEYLLREDKLWETMGDLGFEGGFATGRFSHTFIFYIFRITKSKIKRLSDHNQNPGWKGGPGNLFFSYRLGIPIPLVSKQP